MADVLNSVQYYCDFYTLKMPMDQTLKLLTESTYVEHNIHMETYGILNPKHKAN